MATIHDLGPHLKSNRCIEIVHAGPTNQSRALRERGRQVVTIAGTVLGSEDLRRESLPEGAFEIVPSLVRRDEAVDRRDLSRAIASGADGSQGFGIAIIDCDLPDVEGILQSLVSTTDVEVVGLSVRSIELDTLDHLRNLLITNGFRPSVFDGYTVWALPVVESQSNARRAEALGVLRDANSNDADAAGMALMQKRLRLLGRQLDSARGEVKDLRLQIGAHVCQQPSGADVVERELRARVHELQSSHSWKVTRPLRGAKDLLSAAARTTPRIRARGDSAAAPQEPIVGKAVHFQYESQHADETALALRLTTVGELLGLQIDVAVENVGEQLGKAASADTRSWWLIHIGFVGALPSEEILDELVGLARTGRAAIAIARLRALRARHTGEWQVTAPLRAITTPVFDASFAATTHLHTGVQRVVRNVAPRWVADGVVPIILDEEARAWRAPNHSEHQRLLQWTDSLIGSAATKRGPDDPRQTHVLVPWKTTVIVPELKPYDDNIVLRCAASASGNVFTGIVYDLMPITVSEHVPGPVAADFGAYLAAIKRFARISAISEAAGAEFEGFGLALGSQGLTGPAVQAHLLPLVSPPDPDPTAPSVVKLLRRNVDVPLILQVGSISRHKNQLGTLAAATALWDEGLHFELVFVAPDARAAGELAARVEQQRALGRPVSMLAEVSEGVLWQLYRDARAVAQPSFVEGYGLPISEALSVGTPAITSEFGSMAEIAKGGGTLLVRPDDTDSIATAVRKVLTDSLILGELEAAARARVHTSWEEYSARVLAWLLDAEKGS